MRLTLTVVAGPHSGQEFHFDRHDTFLVGRTADCHFQLSYDDPYFSRRHFLVELNPPRCRVMDLNSRNGIKVNGLKVDDAELKDGDEVRAGQTVFRLTTTITSEHETELQAALRPSNPDITEAMPEIPGYALEKELGRGGMGVVYRAKRLADGERVAIKTVLPAASVAQRDIDRFLREASILEKLKHANIVRHYAGGSAGPLLYIVMEYVNGPTAHQIVRERGPMTVRAASLLVGQALQGLAHAHEQGYVHRDVKPSNLLIGTVENKKRIVKVADFGLARAFNDSNLSGLTMQGDVAGTPAFMAPEQITHYREVRPAADQYSAAATLYWLLTKCFVYDLPSNPVRAFGMMLSEDPIPITERRPDVPGPIAAAIGRAMSRDPGDRFIKTGEFAAALLAAVGPG